MPPALAALESVQVSQRSVQVSQQQLQTTQEGQLTERFTAAVEQIGSEKPEIRLGGIYALERIARDSEKDQPVVVEVLCAFIRLHASKQAKSVETLPFSTDVAAAVTVVVRRESRANPDRVDLTGVRLSGLDLVNILELPRVPNLLQAKLRGAELADIDFGRTDLRKVDLTGAKLQRIRLRGNVGQGQLPGVDLSDAFLEGVNLSNAFLKGARLTNAKLGGADLSHTSLLDADLTGAQLGGARLNDAQLPNADLKNANLQSTVLYSADLSRARNLALAQLRSAHVDATTNLPPPFRWNPVTGQVEKK